MWEVHLSNNEVVKDNQTQPTVWRKLRDRCKYEGLEITDLKKNGESLFPKAESYFIFFEKISFFKSQHEINRQIAGCFYKNGSKVRVLKFDSNGNRTQDPPEIYAANNWDSLEIALEMRIDRALPNSQTVQGNPPNKT